jgi:DNA-binding CsgD family transcriptional regulator
MILRCAEGGAVLPSERERPLAAAAPRDLLTQAAEAELARALVTGDEHRALLAAETLWRSAGTPASVYGVVSQQLADAGEGWTQGFTSLAVANRLISACQRLVARLRPLPGPGHRGDVLLVTPPGDQHALGVHAFGHLVEEAGYRAVFAESLPWDDLAELAAEEDRLVAICLSVHRELDVPSARRGLAGVRRAARAAPVLVGGPALAADPGLPRRLGAESGALTASAGVAHLDSLSSVLTEREREVLSCVARGMTNAEAAEVLYLGAATVKSHMDHIFLKTGTTQRAAAVATAMRKGWLS